LKERQRELEQKREEIARRADSEEVKDLTPNIRRLARSWEPKLEKGCFGFNPLQVEGKILCNDLGLEAECTEQAFTSQGVKALPVVLSGKYHFEVELLRDGACAIGWSSAMSHASSWDMQAFGYSSKGQVIHNNEATTYGRPFGCAGDVVGALLEWKEGGTVVSFMLNGEDLGPAFEVSEAEAVPMQPHIAQAATGLPFHLRLRKTLAFRKAGFRPLADALDSEDLCPFSRAVSQASSERAAALITEEQLENFCVPDAHVVELYDLEGARHNGSSAARLTQRLASALNLPRPWSSHLAVSETEDPTTALVALKRASYAEHLIRGIADLNARALEHATAASRERLRAWRADSGVTKRGRLQGAAARRLIHGSLQTAMPLSHVVEEKNSIRKR